MTEYRKLPRGTEMIGTLGLGMGGIAQISSKSLSSSMQCRNPKSA